jgi:hypothetical protein
MKHDTQERKYKETEVLTESPDERARRKAQRSLPSTGWRPCFWCGDGALRSEIGHSTRGKERNWTQRKEKEAKLGTKQGERCETRHSTGVNERKWTQHKGKGAKSDTAHVKQRNWTQQKGGSEIGYSARGEVRN